MSKRGSKKKVKNLRNVTMLLLVSVLMLSAATYAWFVTSSSADLQDLSLTVGSGGGGLLFHQNTGTAATPVLTAYSSNLKFADIQGAVPASGAAIIYPATAENDFTTPAKHITSLNTAYSQAKSLQLYKPNYKSGDVIDKLDKLTNYKDDKNQAYYYEATFFVKIPDGTNTEKKSVYLAPGNIAEKTGTYLSAEDGNLSPEVIRIAFTINDNEGPKTAIYEYQGANKDRPANSADLYATEETEFAGYGTYTNTIVQGADGKFTSPNSKLFDMQAATDVPMTIQVWFEGRDSQCTNAISDKNIIGGFEFVTKDPSVTP